MAIRRIKSKKRKNPARARSLIANPRRKRAHKNPRRHKRKKNPAHAHAMKAHSKHRRRRHNPSIAGGGKFLSKENINMLINVGIGAAVAVAGSFLIDKYVFQEQDAAGVSKPTKFATENPTLAKVGPPLLLAAAGIAAGTMLKDKTAKSIAYGAGAAGVVLAVSSGAGDAITKALKGESTAKGYLPQPKVYGMGAFGHDERYGHSAGAYLSYDSSGQPAGYFVEGTKTMAGFGGF